MLNIISTLLISFIFNFCGYGNNQKSAANGSQLFIYKITFGEFTYNNVCGIALVNGELYYEPNDSMLLTYKGLSSNAKPYKSVESCKFVESLNTDTLRQIFQNKNNCNCRKMSKSEFVIRVYEDGKLEQFYFPEILNCDLNDPCLFIEKISTIFNSIQAKGYFKKK